MIGSLVFAIWIQLNYDEGDAPVGLNIVLAESEKKSL